MRRADIYVDNEKAGVLVEIEAGKNYIFRYIDQYEGKQVSLTLPVSKQEYHFENFPSFFDGLLPEGHQLEHLLRTRKIDRHDYFSQLIAVGLDMVGNVTVLEASDE